MNGALERRVPLVAVRRIGSLGDHPPSPDAPWRASRQRGIPLRLVARRSAPRARGRDVASRRGRELRARIVPQRRPHPRRRQSAGGSRARQAPFGRGLLHSMVSTQSHTSNRPTSARTLLVARSSGCSVKPSSGRCRAIAPPTARSRPLRPRRTVHPSHLGPGQSLQDDALEELPPRARPPSQLALTFSRSAKNSRSKTTTNARQLGAFLASSAASYITGAQYHVLGGLEAR
jgi:hypothetical protein